MKTWIGAFSVASALFLAFACADDDKNNSGNTGGAGSGGTDAGGAPAITCEPPEPPGGVSDVAGGAGRAASSGGGAGGVGGSGAVASGLAIEGSYVGEFMDHYTVTSSTWSSGSSVYHISAFDNAEHWFVARNDQANMYNPCAWSRFDWTEAGGALYYCTTAYNAESEEAARATPAADASDPATTGCGGFPWSKLTPE